jgi:segregation and condensation protein B
MRCCIAATIVPLSSVAIFATFVFENGFHPVKNDKSVLRFLVILATFKTLKFHFPNIDVMTPKTEKKQMNLKKRSAAPAVEALLFSGDEPIKAARICEIIEGLQEKDVRDIIEELNQSYEETGRSFRIHVIADGYQLFTLTEYANYVEQLFRNRLQSRLSLKALETLAIIAYKQPVTRPEIEEIRGVNVDGVLKTLLTRKLITVAGTAQAPGTPYLYQTTKKFLEYFGLKNIKDLPKLKELDEIVEADSEIQEKFGDHIFREVAPEVLGIQEDETEKEVQESDEEK